MQFKVGDIVRLKDGNGLMKILSFSHKNPRIVTTCYLSSIRAGYADNIRLYDIDRLVLADPQVHQTSHDMEQYMADSIEVGALFATKAEPVRYGTFLTRNSQRKLVLEIKGTNEVLAFEEDEIEEVRPYTASFKPVGGGQVLHMQITENSVEKGDFLINKDGQIVIVCDVNTRARTSATFKGRKLVTTEIAA